LEKLRAKRCVFRRRLKVPSVSDALTLDGKVFQTSSSAFNCSKKLKLDTVTHNNHSNNQQGSQINTVKSAHFKCIHQMSALAQEIAKHAFTIAPVTPK